jgi:uncharacterized protein YjdB
MRGLPPLSLRRGWPLAAAALVLVPLLGGCRDLVRRGPRVDSITISPGAFDIPINGNFRVTATAFDRDGYTISRGTIRFSSESPQIATVTADGTVIGVATGQAIIIASLDDARGQAIVTVIPEVPASVQVSPSAVTLRRTNTRQFTATPRSLTGAPINSQAISWSTSNSAVASVSPSGAVTALTAGTALITATAGGVSGSSTVTVTEIPVASITLAPTSRSLRVDETFLPTVTLRDSALNTLPTLGRELSWSSSDGIVASVSPTGVVRGLQAGTARIVAASGANPDVNAGIDVTVSNREVRTVVITPRTGSLRLGVPRALSATLLDSLNQPITGRLVTWTSLTPTTAGVTSTGSVTGISLGQARIEARVGNAADTVPFTVTPVPVGEVSVTPLQGSVLQGQSLTLTATVRDSTGTEVTDRPVSWLTSAPLVATVNAGVVQAVSPGAAVISAAVDGRVGTSGITVLQSPVEAIVFTNPLDSVVIITGTVAPGNSRQVQFVLRDASGNEVFGRSVISVQTAPSVASVAWTPATRILSITGTAVGTTIVRLRALGATGQPEGQETTVRVTVTAAP